MSEANENGDSWKNPSRIWRKNHREHKERVKSLREKQQKTIFAGKAKREREIKTKH